MKKRRFSEEQVIAAVRERERDMKAADVCGKNVSAARRCMRESPSVAAWKSLDYVNKIKIRVRTWQGRKIMTRGLIPSVLAVCLMLLSGKAFAWDGVKYGKITGVDVTDAENFAVRVYLDGTPVCGTTESWGYVNKGHSNYEAMVAIINSAFLSGRQVTIYTNRTGNYCEIGYLAVR